jgi:Zn-finger nucleic acid-binding protein
MELKEISFRGIQVDRWFSCNGTWLDEGELEKVAKEDGQGSVVAAVLRIFK